MNDLVPYSIGFTAGLAIPFLIVVLPQWKRYVVNCGKVACTHHRDNAQRLNDANDSERRRPPPR